MSEIPIDLGHGKAPEVSMRTDFDASAQLASEEALPSPYTQAIRYGDFSLFEKCGHLRRIDLFASGTFTVHPEDLVNLNDPDEGWKGYWLLKMPGNPLSFREVMALKGMGFQPANYADGFRSQTFDCPEDGFVHYENMVLMVQPSRKFKQLQQQRNVPASDVIRRGREEFHEAVDRVSGAGIGTFEAEGAHDGRIAVEDTRSVVRPG
jgi:hypothetical protein